LRVVLDTNVFVSALLIKGSVADRIIRAYIKGEFTLIISFEIVVELFKVLSRPKFNLNSEKIIEFIQLLEIKAEKISLSSEEAEIIPEDREDEKFIRCALAGKAAYVVSGDNHLLKLKQYKGIKILTPRQFIEILEEKKRE